MSDRDLKCVHCFENQDDYGRYVDATFMFDGLSLCDDHYIEHRDWVIQPVKGRTHRLPESILGPGYHNE